MSKDNHCKDDPEESTISTLSTKASSLQENDLRKSNQGLKVVKDFSNLKTTSLCGSIIAGGETADTSIKGEDLGVQK